ncbi:MAG: BatA domain-containing protein [Rubripirellula sp.]
MFLYPALTIGFLFVAVPLLVHLINMLRHRRQTWAAMDFLLASYRKQKKWIRLRQLLLLLSRLAVAALLIAMLCGWSGGGQMLGMLGGQTTHHVVILDDSYSMGDESVGPNTRRLLDLDTEDGSAGASVATAYGRSLQAIQDLARRLASDEGNHQLTVMRASRAAMAVRGGGESGDAAADLSAQTIGSDARLINRLMATAASSIRTDLVPALDMAAELINSAPADAKYLYIASDFRERDWGSAERLAESMRSLASDVSIRMIDCAAQPAPNLAITDVSPAPDVWVAGVPVVISVTVRNYSQTPAKNVSLASRVIKYSDDLQLADPTLQFSGEVESLPAMIIESLPPGGEITKSFQVFITQKGSHAIEVSLPDDALPIDNVRACTLPLTDAEKVLVIDGDVDRRGDYHVRSVLNPGSQVRIGAVPESQPPSFLRSASLETLSSYRAIYLIDVPEIGENAANALNQYVQRGGGLAWFLGQEVNQNSYNQTLVSQGRYLLPARLEKPTALPIASDTNSSDVQFGDTDSPLLAPLRPGGDATFSLVGVSRSWELESLALNEQPDPAAPRVHTLLKRRDGKPLVTQHDVGNGQVLTVLMGLDGSWTNWPGDPTFVVFLLQSNAVLWSGVAPPTARFVDDELERLLPTDNYTGEVSYLPATGQPPRIPLVVEAEQLQPQVAGDRPVFRVSMDPSEMVIAGEANVAEALRTGVSEWMLTRMDGRGQVVPVASVIRPGEGDLDRADPALIQQQLQPLEVKFVSSNAWSEENQAAGSSTLTMLLLGLLGTILAGEQMLAYWASYHPAARAVASRPGGQR